MFPDFSMLFKRYINRNDRAFLIPILYTNPDFNKKYFLFPLSHFDEAYNSYYHGMLDEFEYIIHKIIWE